MPNEIIITVLANLQKQEVIKVSQLCQRLQGLAHDPSLWREIKLKFCPEQSERILGKVIMRSSQLAVINLMYCSLVDDKVTSIVARHANPFFLKELYLDGCERINDAALT
jgi:hypothetical protein